MLREWAILEACYKHDELNKSSEAKKIGDEMLQYCLSQKFNESLSFPTKGIITQKSLFSFCSSQENLATALVPLNYISDRCVDVTNDEEITTNQYQNTTTPIIEEQY